MPMTTKKTGRPSGPKEFNGGRWTKAKRRSFIMSNLRNASRKWAVTNDILKDARVSRGLYLCASCGEHVPNTVMTSGKRKKNVHVDHIAPIIDPHKGFETWDKAIDGLFCEIDNLQVLCTTCHDIKTNDERAIAAERRNKEKEENGNN